jgi:hypothetical protein
MAGPGNEERWMNRRLRMAGLGAALVVLLGIGAVAGRGVFAQDATPTSGTGSTSATNYQDFVSKLASNLGIADSTQVDAAIKTTLKQMVDEELAAGHISADEANAAKQAIDNGEFGGDLIDFDHGQGGKHGHDDQGDKDGDRGNGGTNDDGDDNATGTPTTSA